MIAIGAGGLDVAVAMGGYPYEIACPEVVEVHLDGTLDRPWVQAKDIILELLRRLTASGGKNKVFEFTGPGTARPVDPRARHDRQHDRRARRHRRRSSRPTTRRATGSQRQQREDDFDEIAPDDGAEYDDRVEIDLAELGPLVAKPHNPDNVVPVEEVAGTEIAQVCIGSSVNSGYFDLALPGAILADRDGQIVHPDDRRAPPRRARARSSPRSPSRASTASSSEGGVRMLEPVCGPCVGMGQAPPSDANSLRTFNRNFPGRSRHARGLRVPVLARGGGGVDARAARSRTRASTATPPELLADARAASPTSTTSTSSRRPTRTRPRRSRSRAGPTSRRRPSTSRSSDSLEAKVATVQPDDISTGDLAPDGVEVMAYRSNIPAIAEFTFRHRDPEFRKRHEGVGERASSSAATTTARAPRASTPRWRRCSSASRRCSPSRSRASTAAT